MRVDKEDQIENVINSISRLIMMESVWVAAEQRNPAYGADMSEDKIKEGKDLIQRLKDSR